MDNNIILFNKDGFLFKKMDSHCYKVEFTMENKNILLANIIDFNLIKLIYDLNPDVYESSNIEHLNENECIINLLMKHFFEDLGLPQRFSFMHINRNIKDNQITFHCQTIKTHRPPNMPPDAELFNIDQMITICDIITPHKITFNFNIIFNPNMNVPPFAEKIIGTIVRKIFNRVKQFIENVTI
jgi:hypothetical protein